MKRTHKRTDTFRAHIRRSSSGVKFRPEMFHERIIEDVRAGYKLVAKKYGWPDFKNDEVVL